MEIQKEASTGDLFGKLSNQDVELSFLKRKPKIRDIAIFCRMFATIINAGVSIMQALEIMKGQTESKSLRETLNAVHDEVKKGKTLSDGMKASGDVFPDFLIDMIKVGELSGNLDDVMNRMADYYENDDKVRSQVKGAMIYPSAIMGVTIIVVVFLIRNVVPTFVSMMADSGTATPLPTKIVLALSNALQVNGIVIILAIAAIIFGIVMFKKSQNGKYFFDTLAFKLPIIGTLNKKVITSRFARTMSILITSGIPIIQSIDILQSVVGNVRVTEALERTREDLQKGKGFAKPISEVPYFHSMLHQMIAIGEETGSLESMLKKTADMYEYEVEQEIKRAMTLMEPAIIVFIGAIVGFIVIAMILPVFSMYNSANMQ